MAEEQVLFPLRPYPEQGGRAFTSGHSGSETSRERAIREDATGVTTARQRETLGMAYACGAEGITVKELRDIKGWHHGQASSALSVLHKENRLARLTERRDRCQVYVSPEFAEGRETAPYKQNRSQCEEAKALLTRVLNLRMYGEGMGETWQKIDSDVEAYLRG